MIDRRFAPRQPGALRSRRVKRLVVLFAVASLASPAAAYAHATLLRSAPADGSVLTTAPRHVTSSSTTRSASANGNAAIANGSRRSVLAGPATVHAAQRSSCRCRRLTDGDYTVRWSIVSDDGHPESGVTRVRGRRGTRASDGAARRNDATSSWSGVLERTLYLLGCLTAGGAAVFGAPGAPHARRQAHGPAGAAALLLAARRLPRRQRTAPRQRPPARGSTHVLKVAIVGRDRRRRGRGARARSTARLLDAASLCALALLAAPTLGGTCTRPRPATLACGPGRPLHTSCGAAIWLGGLITLVSCSRASGRTTPSGTVVVRRFSTTAFAAVLCACCSRARPRSDRASLRLPGVDDVATAGS